MHKFTMLISLSAILFSPSLISDNISTTATSPSSSPLRYVSLNEEFTNRSAPLGEKQDLLTKDFQNLIRNQVTLIFSQMFSEIDNGYTNRELGLQYDFPNGWKGT
ncbi:MAG TPA: hypothetical protein VE594_02585, partial [Nitrososphaeraceae archaeon]|nr:hypothetical protein [Nitrososphaeraceae archaeon]